MIKLSNLKVAYGERVIFDNAEFLVRPGDRIGLVGPNGAGKTTLFRVIAGEEKPDSGDVNADPGTVIGYFSQSVGELAGRSALEEVIAGAGRIWEIGQELERLEHRMGDPEAEPLTDREMDVYGELQSEFCTATATTSRPRTGNTHRLGIGPEALQRAGRHFPAVGRCASPWPASLFSNRTSSLWTSPPTTSTSSP